MILLQFVTPNLGHDYGDLLTRVKNVGSMARPRGELVIEIHPFMLTLLDPRACMVKRQGMNTALTYAECLQLIAGTYEPSIYEALSPGVTKLLTEHGAYGPRIMTQLQVMADELTDDPDSRRAVVYVGHDDDLYMTRKGRAPQDVPCTMSWQFFQRNGKLDMHVHMRSWDLVWGLTADVPVFVTAQIALARALGVELGAYFHVAGNAHIYERHFSLVVEESKSRLTFDPGVVPIFSQQAAARSVVYSLVDVIRKIHAGEMYGHDLSRLYADYPEWQVHTRSIALRAGVVAQKAQ